MKFAKVFDVDGNDVLFHVDMDEESNAGLRMTSWINETKVSLFVPLVLEEAQEALNKATQKSAAWARQMMNDQFTWNAQEELNQDRR